MKREPVAGDNSPCRKTRKYRGMRNVCALSPGLLLQVGNSLTLLMYHLVARSGLLTGQVARKQKAYLACCRLAILHISCILLVMFVSIISIHLLRFSTFRIPSVCVFLITVTSIFKSWSVLFTLFFWHSFRDLMSLLLLLLFFVNPWLLFLSLVHFCCCCCLDWCPFDSRAESLKAYCSCQIWINIC